jgi:hypothetical protein
VRDASVEVSHDASLDDASASSSAPDCACPPDDYFIDATLGGQHERLTAPYELELYCHETDVQMVRTPCSDLYSLSACAAPGYGAPCLYLAVDLTRGPLIGNYFDSTGQTWDLTAASLELGTVTARTFDGTFRATFANLQDGGVLTASGTFHACATKMQACRH